MKTQLTLAVILASAAAATTITVHQATGQATPTNPTVQESDVKLLFAQPFFLDEPYAYDHRADRPQVSAGYLIAVAADPEVVPVMQVFHPLLFAGDVPVERLNDGWQSGVVIGLVPSPVAGEGLALDLAKTPIYWAQPDVLPEALTPADAQVVLQQAVASGVVAQRGETVELALAASGGAVYVESRGMLHRYAADVIERYSPEEVDLISGLRAPLVK